MADETDYNEGSPSEHKKLANRSLAKRYEIQCEIGRSPGSHTKEAFLSDLVLDMDLRYEGYELSGQVKISELSTTSTGQLTTTTIDLVSFGPMRHTQKS